MTSFCSLTRDSRVTARRERRTAIALAFVCLRLPSCCPHTSLPPSFTFFLSPFVAAYALPFAHTNGRPCARGAPVMPSASLQVCMRNKRTTTEKMRDILASEFQMTREKRDDFSRRELLLVSALHSHPRLCFDLTFIFIRLNSLQ